MNKHYNSVKKNQEQNIKYVKTEEEWLTYKKTLDQYIRENNIEVD